MKLYQTMIEGHLSTPPPHPHPPGLLGRRICPQLKLLCTPSCKLLFEISVFVIILLFMYAISISTMVRSRFMLRFTPWTNVTGFHVYKTWRLTWCVNYKRTCAVQLLYRRDVRIPWFIVTWLIRGKLAFVQLVSTRKRLCSMTTRTWW